MLPSIDNHYVRFGILCSLLVSAVVLTYLTSPARHTPHHFRTLGGLPHSGPEKCHYGSLPGHWVSSEPEGAKWQLLGGSCQLHNYLADYKQHHNASLSEIGVLLLSDSTDRYLVEFLCEYLQGSKATVFDPRDGLPSYNAYAFHVCNTTARLQLAAAYYPGVHPTGPYHMNVKQNYTERFAMAEKMWTRQFKRPPDMVVVSSLLWDIARLYSQDRPSVSQPELPPALVYQWMANFSAVLDSAQQHFPHTRAWGYHTSLPPRHNPATGLAEKPYLCRRYYVSQLNAAGTEVARQHGFELVDYYQVGNRFEDGQAYLADLIHFGPPLALEFTNIYLNIIAAQRQAQQAGQQAVEMEHQVVEEEDEQGQEQEVAGQGQGGGEDQGEEKTGAAVKAVHAEGGNSSSGSAGQNAAKATSEAAAKGAEGGSSSGVADILASITGKLGFGGQHTEKAQQVPSGGSNSSSNSSSAGGDAAHVAAQGEAAAASAALPGLVPAASNSSSNSTKE